MHIELKITRDRQGHIVTTYAMLTPSGWHQWGGSPDELAETDQMIFEMHTKADEVFPFEDVDEA